MLCREGTRLNPPSPELTSQAQSQWPLITRWLLLLLLVASAAWAETPAQTNACQAPANRTEWARLLAQNPDDSGLKMRHALRLGLCVKVERGEITTDAGTLIFEQARSALLAQREAQRRQAVQKERFRL